MPRISVSLSDDSYRWLCELAAEDQRPTAVMASLLINQGLAAAIKDEAAAKEERTRAYKKLRRPLAAPAFPGE